MLHTESPLNRPLAPKSLGAERQVALLRLRGLREHADAPLDGRLREVGDDVEPGVEARAEIRGLGRAVVVDAQPGDDAPARDGRDLELDVPRGKKHVEPLVGRHGVAGGERLIVGLAGRLGCGDACGDLHRARLQVHAGVHSRGP